MLIDWFTVGAQTLNFLILVWLMKRFLYKPVLDAIDAREKRIATELASAAKKQTQADTERDTFQKKNVTFDQQHEKRVRESSAEVDAERQRLLTEVRTDADALRTTRQQALESELQILQQDIVRRSQQEAFAIARKVLTDLAGATLEDRMVEVFCQRLGAMDAQTKAELAKALKASIGTVRVRSAFALQPEQQDAMRHALDAALQDKLPLEFETQAEVIGGIELSVDGWKVAWNIAEFLESLESLERSMGERTDPVKSSRPVTP